MALRITWKHHASGHRWHRRKDKKKRITHTTQSNKVDTHTLHLHTWPCSCRYRNTGAVENDKSPVLTLPCLLILSSYIYICIWWNLMCVLQTSVAVPWIVPYGAPSPLLTQFIAKSVWTAKDYTSTLLVSLFPSAPGHKSISEVKHWCWVIPSVKPPSRYKKHTELWGHVWVHTFVLMVRGSKEIQHKVKVSVRATVYPQLLYFFVDSFLSDRGPWGKAVIHCSEDHVNAFKYFSYTVTAFL